MKGVSFDSSLTVLEPKVKVVSPIEGQFPELQPVNQTSGQDKVASFLQQDEIICSSLFDALGLPPDPTAVTNSTISVEAS